MTTDFFSTEQLFQFAINARTMSRDQLQASFLQLLAMFNERENQYRAIIAHKWGLPMSPEQSAIADDQVELELLQCHYKAATQVLDSLSDDQMVARLAVALQGACLALDIKQPAHGDAVAMVRAMCRVLSGDFPATNCRNVQHRLEETK